MKPFNLFVYGTLMNPDVFRAVLGCRLVLSEDEADGVESFWARNAVLDDYKKVSPDNTYFYAVPDPHGRIRGYLIGPLPGRSMSGLRKFEGRNYSRRRVRVHTKNGEEEAVVFLGNLREMEHSFGYQFNDPLKQEVLLKRKIDAALLEAEREQLNIEEELARRAVGELHARTIRDIVRRHFDAGGISDYAIRHSIKDEPLPDFSRIKEDPEAKALADNYLSMVVRQVIFNETEEHIRNDFRFELDRVGPQGQFYERTVSSLAALRILNSNSELLHRLTIKCLNELNFGRNRLVDFVRWAIAGADSIYEARQAKGEIEYITGHMGRGHLPMGAELEFSNIGHNVIRDPQGKSVQDPRYDGFLYFPDFALDVLTWKLGGHIDDHHEKASSRRRRGFFEVALGNLSIEANLSKPVTDDPWLLNQFIHEARRFFEIAPHSVHISLQLRGWRRAHADRLLPLSAMKCLFAIAGDPRRDESGKLQINRLVSDEIITDSPAPGIMFSQISRRHSRRDDDDELASTDRTSGRYVQQFKFLRLSPDLNYEPIAMALKGLQLKFAPGSFMTGEQYRTKPKHKERFEELLAWGASAGSIPRDEMESFLGAVYEGLMTERRAGPAHSEAYIAWSMDQLRSMLRAFNALARRPHRQTRKAGARTSGS